jgi:ATP-dependent exoDNAse (exonuclease V) beta subunit
MDFQFVHVKRPLFNKLERLDTPRGRFYVTPSGLHYPSVTTVLGALPKDSLKAWETAVGSKEAERVRRMAGNRGTRIHEYIEQYLDNKPLEKMSFIDASSFNGLKPILDKYVNNIVLQEAHLWSDHLELAGTVDCVGEFDGKISIIDFKTSANPKMEDDIEGYFLQATAYSIMYEERTGIPINRIAILITIDFDKPQIFVKNRSKYIDRLLEVRKLYKESVNV